MERLQYLESESIKILRSIPQICKKPAMLWSTGKDSTLVLHLQHKAFGSFPFPVIHIDTGKKFQEIYDFRDKIAKEWNLPLSIYRNELAQELGLSCEKGLSKFECCTQLKTEALKIAIRERGFDALILSIRHDEHYVRGCEDIVSLRDSGGNWQWKSHFGGFGLTAPEHEGLAHLRVHPILMWTEAEAWEYTMLHNLPVNPMYFSEDGLRYRSLGCEPCTEPIKSKATTIQEIVNEVYMTPGLERSGRQQDKESKDTMLKLRQLGYM